MLSWITILLVILAAVVGILGLGGFGGALKGLVLVLFLLFVGGFFLSIIIDLRKDSPRDSFFPRR